MEKKCTGLEGERCAHSCGQRLHFRRPHSTAEALLWGQKTISPPWKLGSFVKRLISLTMQCQAEKNFRWLFRPMLLQITINHATRMPWNRRPNCGTPMLQNTSQPWRGNWGARVPRLSLWPHTCFTHAVLHPTDRKLLISATTQIYLKGIMFRSRRRGKWKYQRSHMVWFNLFNTLKMIKL